MYLDAQNLFSDSQEVTATAISENVIDLGPVDDNTLQDLHGEPIYLVIQVTEAAAAAGAATVTFTLESDSTADLATSATTHFSSGAIGKADLTLGAQPVVVALPKGDYERYLGVRFTVATGPLTAGEFDAFLVKDIDNWRAYASRSVIN